MYRLLKIKSDLNQLKDIAKRLAYNINVGDVILLKGELGAGKTTFARFFINFIFNKHSIAKPSFIKSPSFPIMINYPLDTYQVLHYDFYRLQNIKELTELNIIEDIRNNVVLVEWPEIFIQNIKIENYFKINFKIISEEIREITIYHNNFTEI